ncbi:S-adenosyl methyltransferase [Actinopolyspora mzabensis]|uniref:S-adenosyl methyltransferase n=1 Tax=Actinopolyspora mzabensis TaxID=995066 RepID=A0A1G8YBJ6_ACTMZ|nr:SAM-dependent methyltransferase [Actinopolyspora mzabensis]SDK00067.1 S-adenosyl methyltransferase [Actinopolyspora mzabensis]
MDETTAELNGDRPNSARLYDVFLGGNHNTEADRQLAERIKESAPRWSLGAQLNRSFLRCAVHYMAAQGIDQFLDLGSGIPTVGNVHEIAAQHNQRARVVYVDYETIAYNTSRTELADNPNVTILHADLRDPRAVLDHPETRELLDFSRPVGLLIVGVLLFIGPQDRPGDIIATYREQLSSGSYLAISQASDDNLPPDLQSEIDQVVASYEHADEQLVLRTHDEIAGWFSGTELVPPGLVHYPDWSPAQQALSEEQRSCRYGYVGVGRVP